MNLSKENIGIKRGQKIGWVQLLGCTKGRHTRGVAGRYKGKVGEINALPEKRNNPKIAQARRVKKLSTKKGEKWLKKRVDSLWEELGIQELIHKKTSKIGL